MSDTTQLDVCYSAKDKAKSLGAWWDSQTRSWVCEPENEKAIKAFKKIYFIVSYDNRVVAKRMGGKWDKTKKEWYFYNYELQNPIIQKTFTLSLNN